MTRRTRRTAPVVGQLTATLGLLAERPGAQLDLIAEAGVEVLSPDSIALGEPDTLALF